MTSYPDGEKDVGLETAQELTEYRKLYCKDPTSLKPQGVRVRDYIAIAYASELNNNQYTLGYKDGFVTLSCFGQNPEYLCISGLYFCDSENRCYAQVRYIRFAIENYLRKNEGFADLITVKQNMKKLMSNTVPLFNGRGQFKVTNLTVNGSWDSGFETAVRNFIEASKLQEAYKALKTFEHKALFLKHWTQLDVNKQNIYLNPAPSEWYDKMEAPPVNDPVYGKINLNNKYKCESEKNIILSTYM